MKNDDAGHRDIDKVGESLLVLAVLELADTCMEESGVTCARTVFIDYLAETEHVAVTVKCELIVL